MVNTGCSFDDWCMETLRQPGLWRTIGVCVPATAVVLGVVGLWIDWFVLVAVAALLAGLVGVNLTSPHRFERGVALVGLLVIGLPGLAVGFLLDPVSIVGLIGETFDGSTSS